MKNYIVYGIPFLITLFLICIFFVIKGRYKELNNFLCSFINFNTLRLFIIEWFLSVTTILLGLRYLSFWWDYKEFHIIYMFLTIIFSSVFFIYFIYSYEKCKKRIDLLFVLFMIPIGLAFLFLMLPDFVPDEQSHFQRAYLISNFNINVLTDVWIDSDYGIQKIKSYSDIFNHFYINFKPTYTLFKEASNYNFIVYLVPAITLVLGKILHLSLYCCYYLGRMGNLAFFILLVWYAIKIVPKYKKIFFVFCFNPMLLQLIASYSSDASIMAICILSVANFLYLYNKKQISNKDILLTISLIIFIAVAKYVYLPLFGIYFGIIPNLLKIKKKQVKLILICTFFGLLFLLLSFYLKRNMSTSEAFEVYYKTAHVDSAKQMQFILSDKLNVFKMLKQTYIAKKDFYINSMVNNLGWLTIQIPVVSYRAFYINLYLSAFSENSSISFRNRLWFLFVIGCEIVLIVLGMYLYWTTVGTFITEGVQGRYFLPLLLLFMIAISNGILKRLNNILFFLPLILLTIIPSLLSIIQFFLLTY